MSQRRKVFIRPVCYFDLRSSCPHAARFQRPESDAIVEVIMDAPPQKGLGLVRGELVESWEDPHVASCGRILVIGVLG